MSNSVVTTMPQFFHVSTYPAPGDEVDWGTDKTIDTFWANTYYHQYCTYDGFIWNNSPTTETWSVICALNAYSYMTVNDKEYRAETTDGRNYGGPSRTYPDGNAVGKLWTVTLHPGPNAFRIRQYHRWNTPGVWYGNICTNLAVGTPFTYWEDGNGLMVDKKGRGTTDMRNYERMEDPGDGSLFTCVDFSQTDFGHTFQTVRGQDGTLDLNGGVAYAQAVEGAPKVVNGTLTVTNSWTLTAAQVMSPAAVAEGVAFAPGTVFSMTAGEVAQLVKTQTGYVVARDWSGTLPKTADLTRSAGWVLRERDGDLKVVRESGIFIIFR